MSIETILERSTSTASAPAPQPVASPQTQPTMAIPGASGRTTCARCTMDTHATNITFDEDGVCVYCKVHDAMEQRFPNGPAGREALARMVAQVKKAGRGRRYDCVIGISGGRDSSYLLYTAVKTWGLRPLAVHFNDGFSNPVAGENIKKLVRLLNVELRTVSSDWRVSKAIRLAFLKASVPNLEVGTDLGIYATLYGVAVKEGCRAVFTGNSFRTEGVSPLNWSYLDSRYLSRVVRRFTGVRLPSWRPEVPGYRFSPLVLAYSLLVKGVRSYSPLYSMDYVRSEIDTILTRECGWVNPGAHYFDDLWQSLLYHVYRVKFGIDKRRFNYAALVRTGQMDRADALARLSSIPPIEDPRIIDLCLKRLGLARSDFDALMRLPPRNFTDYPSYFTLIRAAKPFIWLASRLGLIPPGTFDKFFRCR